MASLYIAPCPLPTLRFWRGFPAHVRDGGARGVGRRWQALYSTNVAAIIKVGVAFKPRPKPVIPGQISRRIGWARLGFDEADAIN